MTTDESIAGAPPPPPDTLSRTAWRTVALAVAMGIAAAAFVGKVPPALPRLRDDLGLDLVDGGWVASLFNGLGMLFGALIGVHADRLGVRRALSLAAAALIGGALLGAMAPGLWVLLAARLLEGLGFLLTAVTAPVVILAATAPRDRPMALSLWSLFTPAGIALALLAAPPILETAGWRGLWLAVAALAAVLAALLWRESGRLVLPARGGGTPGRRLAETAGRIGLWIVAVGFAAYAFQWVTLMIWLPSFLVEARALDATLAGALTAGVVAANLPGNLLGGWFLRQGLPPGRLIGAASLCMGLCAPGIFSDIVPDPWRYGLCLVFSLTGGMLPAASLASAPGLAPSPGHVGAANGMILQGSNTGQLFGPPAVAAVVAWAAGDWTAAGTLMIGAAAVAAGCGVLLGFVRR